MDKFHPIFTGYVSTYPACWDWIKAMLTHQRTGSALVQVMACRLFGAKPLPEPMLGIIIWTPRKKIQWKSNRNSIIFIAKMYLKLSFAKVADILSWGDELTKEVPCKQGYVPSLGALWTRSTWADDGETVHPVPEQQHLLQPALVMVSIRSISP